VRTWLFAVVALTCAACGGGPDAPAPESSPALSGTPGSLSVALPQRTVAFAPFLSVVVDGDSISSGYELPSGTAYPWVAQTLLPEGYLFFVDIAVPGETFQTMEANVQSKVCARLASVSKPGIAIASIFGGSNDLVAGFDPNALLKVAAAYYQAAAACGARYVIAWTILPRASAWSFVEPNRITYNAALRSGYRGMGADALVDIGADPVLGNAANVDDTTIYMDGVHPTQAEHEQVIGPAFAAALGALR
jgi:GDSL-like Lipase/Acylhydrolase family